MKTIGEHKCFSGLQRVCSHFSEATGTEMRFSIYLPPEADARPAPVLWYLSGLTCTEENFTVKSGVQRYAAQHGLIVVAPDTSPRGADVPGEDADYDFGSGAGFYVDATRPPWSRNYRMYSYVTEELPALVFENFGADPARQGITGHSMGGHGALTAALRNPETYRSVSAFSPICAPARVPWGVKAFEGYLGRDENAWREYDATALVWDGRRTSKILIDQGDADEFLHSQLRPELFQAACEQAGQALELRMQAGYDHSYFFIASFIGDHVRFHAEALKQ
jgi:S-formylglutathione hydrolase